MQHTQLAEAFNSNSLSTIKRNILINCLLLIFIQHTFLFADDISTLSKTLPINLLPERGVTIFLIGYFTMHGKYLAIVLLLAIIPYQLLMFIKNGHIESHKKMLSKESTDTTFSTEYSMNALNKIRFNQYIITVVDRHVVTAVVALTCIYSVRNFILLFFH